MKVQRHDLNQLWQQRQQQKHVQEAAAAAAAVAATATMEGVHNHWCPTSHAQKAANSNFAVASRAKQ